MAIKKLIGGGPESGGPALNCDSMKIKDLILALAAVFFMSCGRDKPTSCLIGYEFEVPFTITPTTDTISTGDTLWLSTDFTNYLKDHVSGSSYTVNDFDFKAVIILRQLVSDTLILSAQPGAYPK